MKNCNNIFKITDETLKIAKERIENGELVAFPTETVYGLGANAFLDEAILSVYAKKGRPGDNPLIVHVHKDYDISTLVFEDKPYQKLIKDAFMPGPITLVYKSKNKVSPLVSCGLETLAIRIPKSLSAQRFLKAVNLPIAAPSANVSKHTSPVTAQHVYDDFKGEISMILDGGRCEGGIESTVVDVTGEYPVILRKGLITAEMIKKVCGKCEYATENSALNSRSPGTKYRHYCPSTKTLLFGKDEINLAIEKYNETIKSGKTACIMCENSVAEKLKEFNVLNLGLTGEEMASRLYYYLHEGEKFDLLIGIKFDADTELKQSVENRFIKAYS